MSSTMCRRDYSSGMSACHASTNTHTYTLGEWSVMLSPCNTLGESRLGPSHGRAACNAPSTQPVGPMLPAHIASCSWKAENSSPAGESTVTVQTSASGNHEQETAGYHILSCHALEQGRSGLASADALIDRQADTQREESCSISKGEGIRAGRYASAIHK